MPKSPFLKLVITVVVILGVAGVGYAGLVVWREMPMETEEAGVITRVEPAADGETTAEQRPPFIQPEATETDISGWQIYHNEEYGFEIRYPGGYTVAPSLRHDDPLGTSRLIYLYHEDDPRSAGYRMTIHAFRRLESQEKESQRYINLWHTLPQFIEYITDPKEYERLEQVRIGEGRSIPVFFFQEENPGWFDDPRDTFIAVAEQNDVVLFIRKAALGADLDAEFKAILSTLQFDENSGGNRNDKEVP